MYLEMMSLLNAGFDRSSKAYLALNSSRDVAVQYGACRREPVPSGFLAISGLPSIAFMSAARAGATLEPYLPTIIDSTPASKLAYNGVKAVNFTDFRARDTHAFKQVVHITVAHNNRVKLFSAASCGETLRESSVQVFRAG